MIKHNGFFIIEHIGDYHAPRLLALSEKFRAEDMKLKVVEINGNSNFYKHSQTRAQRLIRRLELTSLKNKKNVIVKLLNLFRELSLDKPEIIYVIGYQKWHSMAALFYAKIAGAKIIFMSDSKADDHKRIFYKEWLKTLFIKLYDGALVAGVKHKMYLSKLGMNTDIIKIGYDVIDNVYFEKRALKYKRRMSNLSMDIVLCVSRLVKRKNIDMVIRSFIISDAYKNHRLIIIGDGPLKEYIQSLILELDKRNHIILINDVKNSRMPFYYSQAKLSILLSEYDQWGLVANESLAAGTPVIVTKRCGCADEIVIDNVNGFVVADPSEVKNISNKIDYLCFNKKARKSFSTESKRLIKDWNLINFSENLLHFKGL